METSWEHVGQFNHEKLALNHTDGTHDWTMMDNVKNWIELDWDLSIKPNGDVEALS